MVVIFFFFCTLIHMLYKWFLNTIGIRRSVRANVNGYAEKKKSILLKTENSPLTLPYNERKILLFFFFFKFLDQGRDSGQQ